MSTNDGLTEHYPNIKVIKESIRALHSSLPHDRIKSFSVSISPSQFTDALGCHPIIGVQRLAVTIAKHLQLPAGCAIVNFRDMNEPGRVELTSDETCLVELHSRYKKEHQDIPGILAHEITHVFLHRLGLGFSDTQKNEVFTDTAATYLGVGWLCLNAYRMSEESYVNIEAREIGKRTVEHRIGYLTPEEFGYVLGKRSLFFREQSDEFITSIAAKQACHEGYGKARSEYTRPPLSNSAILDRVYYYWNRRLSKDASKRSHMAGWLRPFRGYQFDVSDASKVIFECPICSQKLRLPIQKRIWVRCALCHESFQCKT